MMSDMYVTVLKCIIQIISDVDFYWEISAVWEKFMDKGIKLSIVIPTKNRANLLKAALESIEKQKADIEAFEVIVIDNGSTDDTKDVVKQYRKRNKNCRYFYDARPGLHVGRNRGLLESRGELVGYLDDDVTLFPNWINTVLQAFEDKEVMYVGGSVIPYDMSVLTPEFRAKYEIHQRAYRLIYPISCFWEAGITEKDTRVHRVAEGCFFGGNSVYRKSVLYACRGFHPDGMPNNLLMYRGDGETYVARFMIKNKMKAMYYAQASVYHMIDGKRVDDSYIDYVHFRAGISDMYTCLRESGIKGGMVRLMGIPARSMRAKKLTGEIRGELYLLFYYIFYERVRQWVHKRDYF